MKHVSILVPASDAVVGSIEGPHKVLSQVNDFLLGMGRPAAFKIELVGLSRERTFNQGLFTLHADRTIADTFQTDLIIIPAPYGDLREAVELNRAFLLWMTQQHKNGASGQPVPGSFSAGRYGPGKWQKMRDALAGCQPVC